MNNKIWQIRFGIGLVVLSALLYLLQWLDYMRHLKADYPYLFSLAIRTNPFRHDASPIIHKA